MLIIAFVSRNTMYVFIIGIQKTHQLTLFKHKLTLIKHKPTLYNHKPKLFKHKLTFLRYNMLSNKIWTSKNIIFIIFLSQVYQVNIVQSGLRKQFYMSNLFLRKIRWFIYQGFLDILWLSAIIKLTKQLNWYHQNAKKIKIRQEICKEIMSFICGHFLLHSDTLSWFWTMLHSDTLSWFWTMLHSDTLSWFWAMPHSDTLSWFWTMLHSDTLSWFWTCLIYFWERSDGSFTRVF
jgi:hypothetical protein